jgi:hypothetical protein
MTTQAEKSIILIKKAHQLHEKLGRVELANSREGFTELHFHTQEENHNGVLVSETKVLKSNAGYYVGHEGIETPEGLDQEFGYWAPYDRISGYYATREAASTDLELYRKALGH